MATAAGSLAGVTLDTAPVWASAQMALSEQFDTEFEIWERDADGVFRAICGSRLSESRIPLDPEHWAKAFDHPSEPLLADLPDGRHLLAMPAGREGRKQFIAAAAVQLDPRILLSRLATASLGRLQTERAARESRLLAEAYARQVSLDFEELTWLRNLAEYLKFCDVTSRRDDVAENVLPPLRQVVQAEALVSLSAEPCQTDPEIGVPGVGSPVFWTGTRLLDDATCRDLVESVVREVGLKPVVRNNVREKSAFAAAGGIDSFILVPAVKNGSCTGWLLALNRIQQPSTNGWQWQQTVCSENEFGTFEANLIAAAAVMLATHAWNRELYEEKELLLVGVIRALINAMDAKDAYTCGHSDRVALMARRLGKELDLSSNECEKLYMTGLLHDVGKIGVPDDVLQKPGKLAEEFNLIKQHPVIGFRILRHLTQLSYALPGVLHHHEAVDGSGYPDGLQGDNIPFGARILAVVDAFDAMTSSRPYREAMPVGKAETILKDGAGTQWDARIVDAFFRVAHDIHKIRRKSYAQTRSLLCVHESDGNVADHDSSDPIVSAVSAARR